MVSAAPAQTYAVAEQDCLLAHDARRRQNVPNKLILETLYWKLPKDSRVH